MPEELGDGVVFRFELFVRENGVHGVMTIATNGERDFTAAAARDEMMIGRVHVGPFAQRAGIDGGGGHTRVITSAVSWRHEMGLSPRAKPVKKCVGTVSALTCYRHSQVARSAEGVAKFCGCGSFVLPPSTLTHIEGACLILLD